MTNIKYNELEATKLGTHQNAESWDLYQVWVTGPRHYEFSDYRTYASGLRDAKRQALEHFNE